MGQTYPSMQYGQGHIWDRMEFIFMETRSFVPLAVIAGEQTPHLP